MKRFAPLLAVCLCLPFVLDAQRPASSGIPADVARTVAQIYNAPETHRASGTVDIGRDSVVTGSIGVRGGTLTIAGRITGSVVAINTDIVFLDGARVSGDVYVVGGRIEGRANAAVDGDVLSYAETLRYRMAGERLALEESGRTPRPRTANDDFWNQRRRMPQTRFDMFSVRGGSAYNRVEGYPILVGPRLRVEREWGTYSLYARGIVRTAEPMRWDRGTLGHDVRTEIRWRNGAGIGVGVAAFDKVEPVESWHMSDSEVALAAVALHRDFRDYYGRHGGRAFVSAYLHDQAWVSVGYGTERWESRAARGPWSLFRDSERWRSNPAADEGDVRLLTGALTLDTRNQAFAPGAGWYISADIERGQFESRAPRNPDLLQLWVSDNRTYTRGFLDVRRYNRLAPGAQLNVRAVFGGWMNGDALPAQRRLSVGGPGTLPGFDFRSTSGGEDRLQCSGRTEPERDVPVMCDRIALVQMEYRGSLSWSTSGVDEDHWWPRQIRSPSWLVFANAGRGWRAHGDAASGYTPQSFPALNTFKSDIGIGLAWESASISVAKSVSDKREPANVVLRLTRRF